MRKVNEIRKVINNIANGEFNETLENDVVDPLYYDMIDDFNKMILELQSNTLMKKDFILLLIYIPEQPPYSRHRPTSHVHYAKPWPRYYSNSYTMPGDVPSKAGY